MAKCPHCKSENIHPTQILKKVEGKIMQTGSAKTCDDCDMMFGLRDFKKPREY
jgi:hypothetical protein